MAVHTLNAAALVAGDTNVIAVRLSDAAGVANATITVTASTGVAPTFRNDGVAPDFRAGDATHTAKYILPAGVASVTLTFVASAPGKVTATNSVTYYRGCVPSQ